MELSDLSNKVQSEQETIKNLAICESVYNKEYIDKKSGITFEFIGLPEKIKAKELDGIQVFVKAWRNGKQLGFGDGSVEIEKIRLFNCPVLIESDEGDIVKNYTDLAGNLIVSRQKLDPSGALVESLFHTIGLVGKESEQIVKGKVGNTVDTFNPAAGSNSPVDGTASREGQNETWASVRAGAGTAFSNTTVNQSTFTLSTTTSDQYWGTMNLYFCFNTASIPDGNVISSAVFTLYGSTKGNLIGSQVIHIVESTQTATNTLEAADFDNVGSTSFASKSYADWAITGNANDLTLNASGISNINKTGVSKFAVTTDWFLGLASPTWASATNSYCGMYHADNGTLIPKLVVTHAPATSISTINGLTKSSVKTYNGLAIASVKTLNGLS